MSAQSLAISGLVAGAAFFDNITGVALSRIPNLPPPVRKFLRRPKSGSGNFDWDADEHVSGNKLSLFVRGKDLFAAMAAAIDAAAESVNLETYRFGEDRTGREFAALLARASRRGLRVRVILDSVGSIELAPETETLMRNAGVQILEYHPVAPWRPHWAWNRRDHRKMLVCDGRIGFIGGMNISDEHSPEERGGLDWPDAHARVEGPAALQLEALFRTVWHKETGRWFDASAPNQAAPGRASVRIVGNSELIKRFEIRQAYVNALSAAQAEVAIANSYFIPDWRVRRSLALAARRGVDVRVLVPGLSDIRSVWYAMRATYAPLLERGVRIFEWQGPMMHAKAVVVDGKWCSLGSYNLDHRSLRHNLEANLQTTDAPFAADLKKNFELGLAGAREITRAGWERRSWAERALERFFASFGYFF